MSTGDAAGASLAAPVGVALIGAGRIGTHHATALARRVPGARLLAVVDPVEAAAESLAGGLGARAAVQLDPVLDDPEVEAVVITAISPLHSQLVQQAARAGKAVFCEKPMAMTLAEADAAIDACDRAGVPLQVGFNRRFASDFAHAHAVVSSGEIGTPQLMRSLTRDPGLADPGAVPPGTIFTQTLIHDFDTVNWLNPGARAVEVHAWADALVAPDFRDAGLQDTAVVTLRYDNGALATAEASFSAAYGYDVRGEVFGSSGMVTIGTPAHLSVTRWDGSGSHAPTARRDTDLLGDAYRAELQAFCDTVRSGGTAPVTGRDARDALAVALAAIESAASGRAVAVGAAS